MNTSRVIPLWFLAMLTLTGTLAMHIFVPVLPLVAHDFNASLNVVQLTLSVYIFGLAIGQLFYGPLADSIGRKPVLIFGMVAYAIASIGAMLAPTIEILIFARFLQALGGCSGLLLGRAIVQDTSTGNETTKKLSLMNMMVMLGPGLSPIIGGILGSLTSWRSIFAFLSLLGMVNLYLICVFISKHTIKKEASAKMVFQNYKKLIISRKFIGYTIGGGLSTTSFYAFLSVASFVFIHQLDKSIHEVSIYLVLIMLGIWLGSFTSNRLIDRLSNEKMITLGTSISFVSGLAFFLFIYFGYMSVPTIIIPIICYCFSVGITSPSALSKALNVNPLVAGSASGIYGFLQMAIGALCTSLSGFGSNPAFSAACVLLGACIIAQICFKLAKSIKE